VEINSCYSITVWLGEPWCWSVVKVKLKVIHLCYSTIVLCGNARTQSHLDPKSELLNSNLAHYSPHFKAEINLELLQQHKNTKRGTNETSGLRIPAFSYFEMVVFLFFFMLFLASKIRLKGKIQNTLCTITTDRRLRC
jgi:hypothetical protein